MKKLFSILFFLTLCLTSYSQQEISICEESNNTFNYITSSGQPGTYTWLIDGVLIADNDSLISIDWQLYNLGNHLISVTFYNSSGCSSPTIFYSVNLLECPNSTLYAPNAFTPNSDGLNNVWLPLGYNIKEIEFTVFNRWGELIFESKDQLFGWDGTYKGQECQNDVYVYMIKWTDNKNRVTVRYGHITLLR